MPELPGLAKGLGVTFKTMINTWTNGAVTVQYPHEKEDLDTWYRDVIDIKVENCIV